jgi:hypothetical protein
MDSQNTEHMWSAAEVEKDILKVGQVYCVECKRRNGNRMCTTCWDPYCDLCFKAIHHKGSLRGHDYLPYQEAKAGWSIVKARMPGEQDYYVHGVTGETTFDKPMELMTESEKIFFHNFQIHQAKAEEHVKKIDELQIELESAQYERDTLMYDALQGGGGTALTNIMKKKKKKGDAAPVQGSGDVMAQVSAFAYHLFHLTPPLPYTWVCLLPRPPPPHSCACPTTYFPRPFCILPYLALTTLI